jgi:hypothetical protein
LNSGPPSAAAAEQTQQASACSLEPLLLLLLLLVSWSEYVQASLSEAPHHSTALHYCWSPLVFAASAPVLLLLLFWRLLVQAKKTC